VLCVLLWHFVPPFKKKKKKRNLFFSLKFDKIFLQPLIKIDQFIDIYWSLL
jgi:hypothetical protein